jgi:hypothetical protein
MLKKLESKCEKSNGFSWGLTAFGILLMIIIYFL